MMKRQWIHAIVAAAGLVGAHRRLSRRPGRAGESRRMRATRSASQLAGSSRYGFDSRPREDVLVQDLSSADFPHYLFDIDDFHHFTFGGEYLFGITENLEVGASVGFYSKGVNSIYADVVHPDQTEIEQRLKLRIVPITAP